MATYTFDQFMKLGGATSPTQVKSKGVNVPIAPKPEKKSGETGLRGFATGVGKGILSTVKGAGQLGTKLGNAVLPESLEIPDLYSEESLEADKAKGGFRGKLLNKENLEGKSTAEKLGKFTEQAAEFIIPATKLGGASTGLNLAKTIGTRAATSGTVAAVQSGGDVKDVGTAAAVETAIPVAGKFVVKPAVNLLGRLFKGLGGGLSGTSTNIIDQIVSNPKSASSSIKELEKLGASKVVEKNAKTIINGVSKIRQNARKAFGEGLDQLSKTDIEPKVFRSSIQPTLDKFGAVTEGGKKLLKNVEFDDPKNIVKARDLISRLSKVELDGKSLRKLADDIENAAFKTATSDERLAFNVFIKDLSQTLKNAISSSTSKLDDINKAFSTDMQLVEALENELGKVEFKNLAEVVKVSKKLESLFNKNGMAPEVIDNFLNKIGVGADNFKTSEAVRQISSKVAGTNRPGFSLSEIIQSVTSAVVTPKAVRNISVATGIAEASLKEVLEKMSPSARGIFIKALLSGSEED